MYKQLRNDGFTLVEVIVSIAIGTVVLGLVLSMITTAFSNFGTASNTNLKKSSLDGIVSYVRGCVLNAGDIVVSKHKPDGDDWKWLYVSQGMLYKGSKSGESKVFDSGYYNKKAENDTSSSAGTLEMKVEMNHEYVSKDDSHVYSGLFSYKLSDRKEHFTRNDKAVFSNVTGTTSSYDGDIQNIEKNKNEDYDLNTDATGLKLYYKKAIETDNNENNKETGDYKGTVADKINAMTPEVNRGYFVGTVNNTSSYGYFSDAQMNYLNTPAHNTYRLGDYVYYQGYWYMLVKNADPANKIPGNGSGVWQKLTEDYTTNNPYVKGDVVKYNDAYYRVAIDYLKSGDIPGEWNTKDWPNKMYEPNKILFEYIGTKPDSTKPGYDTNWNDPHDPYGEIKTLLNGSRAIPDKSPLKVRQTMLNGVSTSAINYDQFSDVKKFTADQINAGAFDTDKFQMNDLVAIEVKNSGKNGSNNESDAPYYRLYQKIFNPIESLTYKKKIPGNSSLSGWRLLENSYCPGSSYASGDVVRLGTSVLNDIDSSNYIQLNKSSDIQSTLGKSSFTFNAYSSLFGYKFNNQTLDLNDNGSLETLMYFSLYLNLINDRDFWIACSSFGIELTDLKGDNRDANLTIVETAMIHKVGMDDEESTSYGNALWKCGKALWKEMSYNEALKAS